MIEAQRHPPRLLLPNAPHIRSRGKSRVYVRSVEPLVSPPLYDLSPEVTLRRGVDLLNRRADAGLEATPWWIGVGTALGFGRERDFLPWDTDIDVRILLDHADVAAALNYAAGIAALFQADGFELVREMYWEQRPMQLAFADRQNRGVIFDIYFFYDGMTPGHVVNYNNANFREKPRRLIENMIHAPWPTAPDIIVNVPGPVEDYLAWRFGETWRTLCRDPEARARAETCLNPLPVITTLTYGTFDGFHYGHLRLLQRAANLGDRLIVVVVSDALLRIKGKTPMCTETQRAEVVRALRCVSEVHIQQELDQKEKDIDRFGADFLVAGDDWAYHPRFEQVRDYHGCRLVYMERTPGISSTIMRERVLAARQAQAGE